MSIVKSKETIAFETAIEMVIERLSTIRNGELNTPNNQKKLYSLTKENIASTICSIAYGAWHPLLLAKNHEIAMMLNNSVVVPTTIKGLAMYNSKIATYTGNVDFGALWSKL